MRQIEAIKSLISNGKILSLPEELRYTADLRLVNPAASLFELSHMHEPPISKSGLNRRLTRLIEESEDI
jgi:DNA-binding transcriptional regulator WhiA